MRTRKWTASAAMLIVGASFLVGVMWGTADSGLYIGNGLGIPVVVNIDDDLRVEVEAGRQAHVPLASGVHMVRTETPEGVLVETLPVAVQSLRTNLYSVLGSAPFFTVEVVYRRVANPALDAAIRPVVLMGRTTAQVEADDVFEKPPETVSMRRSEFTITRTYLGVAEGGWENKLGSMEPEVALQLLRRIHRVEPEAALESLWSTAFYTLGPEAAGQLAHHHQAQNLQQAAATLMPADLPALRAAVAADPTNAELVYRLSAQLSVAESETLFRNFLKENPKNLAISLQLASVLGDQKRAEEALTLLDGLPPGPEVDTVRSYVLAGAGRAKEALELLPPTAEGDTAIYRARLAALAGVSIPPSTDPFVQARCSLFSNPEIQKSDLMLGLTEDQRRLVSIEWAATRDPAEAWPLLRNATVLDLDTLHRHVRLLLGLEFMRMGDSLLGMALLDLDSRAPDGTWEQALEPEQPLPVAYEHLPASMRAAVLFVRSRVLYSRAQIMEAERLRAAAMAEEDVPGAVHLANQYWPPPDSAPPK